MIIKILAPVVVTSLPILQSLPSLNFGYRSLLVKSKGQLVPLDSSIELSIENAFDQLSKIKFKTKNQWKREKSYFQFNYTKLDCLITSGSIWFHQCDLGLPYNISFNHLSQATDYLEIKGLYLDWKSPENMELASTYLLSDLAKQFLIVQGVCKHWNKKTLPINILINIVLSAIFVSSYQLNQPLIIKFALIAVLILGVVFLSSETNSAINIESIEETLKLDDRYLDGAIEFYQKVLNRNTLLDSRYNNEIDIMSKMLYRAENSHVREILNFLMKEKMKQSNSNKVD